MGTPAIPFNAHGYQFNDVISTVSGMYHSVNHPVRNSSRECYLNNYCGFWSTGAEVPSFISEENFL